jgi:AcrR family transcriptional regulator
MPLRSRSARPASAAGSSRRPRPCSRASATRRPRPRRSPARPGYEHFGNKEDCIVALFDAATEIVLDAMRDAAARDAAADPQARVRTTLGAFLGTLAHYPDESQTLLVEIVGAGPRAMERRDRALEAVAQYLVELNAEDAARGATPRFASPDDAFAIVGAVVELASRQIRTGVPGDIRELEPVVERLSLGLMAAGERP